MALAWAWGFEIKGAVADYTGWNSSGSVTPNNTTTVCQHPDGYGGGEVSLRCGSGEYLEAPSPFSLVQIGQMQSAVYGDDTWSADGTLLALIDSNGDRIVEARSVDADVTSRLVLMHAGTTIAMTGSRLLAQTWQRVTMRYSVTAGTTVTGQLYLDGTLVASGDVALATLANAKGVRWGGAANGDTYHDHTAVWDDWSAEGLAATWVQGLRPDSDDDPGSWTPSTGSSLYPTVEHADDADYSTTTTDPDGMLVGLQNRSDVGGGWDPVVRGVQINAAGLGSAGLDQASVTMKIGANVSTGLTMTVASTPTPVSFMRLNAPGGSGWAGADLDSLLAGYRVST